MKKNLLFAACCLFSLLAVGWAYSDFFGNAFHFDDNHVIENNLYLRSLGNLTRFFTDASTGTSLAANANYRPLVTLSLALDHWIAGGLDARPFHITQFALLVSLGVLLFFFYRRIIGDWPALFAATLFCLHTANTETLNIISARSELLCALGVAGSFLLYLRGGWTRRTWVFLLPMALGALAKVPAVMFAPLLFVYVFLWTPKRPVAEAVRRTWPAFALGLFLFLFMMKMDGPDLVRAILGRWEYARTQPYVWLHYVRLFFLPTGLTADTDWRVFASWADPRLWAGVLFLAILGGSLFLLAKAVRRSPKNARLRPVAFGLAWFAIALLPSSSVFPLSEVANEHRIFLPYIGLALAFAQAGRIALDAVFGDARVRTAASAAAVLAVLLLGAHAWGTHERNKVWQNDETLWADVVEKSPGNGRALMNYGLSQMARGRMERAKELFERAKVHTPNYSYLETNLGIVHSHLNAPEIAEEHFRRALELEPRFASGHFFYARWLLGQGRGPEALYHLETAQRLSPGNPEGRRLLLGLYAAQGDGRRLAELIRSTRAIDPSDPDASAYESGRFPGLRNPEDPYDEGVALLRKGRHVDAALAFRRALALDPRSADAMNNLGWALAKLGFYGDAVPWFDQALKHRPGFDLARNNLAWARSQMEK